MYRCPARLHTFIEPSLLPETQMVPSLDNATALTLSVCPIKIHNQEHQLK